MDIARLNKRVTFQRSTVITDGIGNHRNVWADYYTCSATISDESGDEERDAGEKLYRETLSVTVRYCRTASGIMPSDYRLVIDDIPYDINSVDHFAYRKRMLRFRCRRVRR